jgi:hypothetical protein
MAHRKAHGDGDPVARMEKRIIAVVFYDAGKRFQLFGCHTWLYCASASKVDHAALQGVVPAGNSNPMAAVRLSA